MKPLIQKSLTAVVFLMTLTSSLMGEGGYSKTSSKDDQWNTFYQDTKFVEVRVRILKELKSFVFQGEKIRIEGASEDVNSSLSSFSKLEVISGTDLNGQRKWKVNFLEKNKKTFFVTSDRFQVSGKKLFSAGRSLPDKIFISKNKEKLDLIGVMNLENYLIGVISSEMPLSWPLESLKAQAVAARSYTLNSIKQNRERAFHVESSVLDQVFQHISDNKQVDKAVQAVMGTRGEVLTLDKKNPMKAFYHSDCGGSTIRSEKVWGSQEDAGTAEDLGCSLSKKSQWSLVIDREEFESVLRIEIPFLQKIEKIKTETDIETKRVGFVLILDSSKRWWSVKAEKVRELYGYQRLKSTQFNLTMLEDKIVLSGKGFGHGVGLCQHGSKNLALNGESYHEILKHYYPKAHLIRNDRRVVFMW